MEKFEATLRKVFGEKAAEFSPHLRGLLQDLWLEGVEAGIPLAHVCGGFSSSRGGMIGPMGCEACRILDVEG